MKRLDVNTYNLYSPVIPENRELKIVVFSDIHFSPQVKSEKLQAISYFVHEQKPNYIFIPGDLLDYTDTVKNSQEKARLLSWLKDLALLAPTIISLGNHDIYRKSTPAELPKNGVFTYYRDADFLSELSSLKNLHVLDNSIYADQKITVLGLTHSYNYFSPSPEPPSIFHPKDEVQKILLEDIQNLDKSALTPPSEKLNFALIHSPTHLKDSLVTPYFKNYHYLISGHFHNGIVPPVLDQIWRSDRGFVSPTRNLFPKNARHTLKTPEDKLIVGAAVTTFSESSGPFHRLNALYPTYLSVLRFTNNPAHKVPRISHKMLKYAII